MTRGKNQRGASAVEYALLVAGVVVALVFVLPALSSAVVGHGYSSSAQCGSMNVEPGDPCHP